MTTESHTLFDGQELAGVSGYLQRRTNGSIPSGSEAIVLDACCGARKFWFNAEDPRAIYMDRREDVYIVDRGTPGTVGRKPVVVAPQILADFTEMPFPDEAFWHVVFDPPHYSAKSMSATSKLAHSYGMLVAGWEEMLSAGFRECFRVLKPYGTLIFKWCAAEISLPRVLALTPEKPLYGHRSGKKAATVWVAFIKTHRSGSSCASGDNMRTEPLRDSNRR